MCVCVCEREAGGGRERVGSVSGSLSCLMQCRGFDPPLRRIIPVEGTFPFRVNMGSDPILPKLFG